MNARQQIRPHRCRCVLTGDPEYAAGKTYVEEASHSAAALGPLNAKELRARLIELFPIAYLTLVAIIQGAAFGLIFVQVGLQSQLKSFTWSAHTAMTLTQAFATALAIVFVTHEYLMITIVLRWETTVWDTLIPYCLGSGELWMALATGHITSWWIALAVLSGSAVLAFLYTQTRSTGPGQPGKSSSQAVLVAIKGREGKMSGQVYLALLMLIFSITFAFLNYFYSQSNLAGHSPNSIGYRYWRYNLETRRFSAEIHDQDDL